VLANRSHSLGAQMQPIRTHVRDQALTYAV
jgi:hypothetical protein